MSGPLTGIRVLELGTLIAGPFAARLFAEFGAEVIKIEAPGKGDPLRNWRKLHNGTSLWWYLQSRNKKSIALDLKSPEGIEVVKRLAASADVVIENFRPGALEKLGIGWDVLSALNPSLTMVRISGYGQTGPYRDRPAVIGALMALLRVKTGQGGGQVVDVSLFESVFNMMESLVPEYDLAGEIRQRSGGALPGISPSNTYRTAAGEYVVIAGNSDLIFRRLMGAIGRPDLAADPDLAHNSGRVKRNAELDRAISDWTEALDMGTILAALERAEVPAGPIYSVADIVADPHYQARGMIEPMVLPDGVTVRMPGLTPKLSETPGEVNWPGPALGEHTDAVLADLGYDTDQIAALRDKGAVA
jgi:crotonobetainyl-CoA:carnitine CoA-transferase CaiB-like acyl-CoA transferase